MTYDTIIQYDADSDNWDIVGHMMERRCGHAVMVMDTEEFSDHCTFAPATAGENSK